MTQDEINAYAKKFGVWAIDGEVVYVFTSDPVYTGWDSYPCCANAITCREINDTDGPSIPSDTKIRVFYNESTGFTKLSEGYFDFSNDEEIFSLVKEIEPTLSQEEKRGMGVWANIDDVATGKTDSLKLSEYIPRFIRQLSGLKKLSFSSCCVPEWIGELKSLEELNMNACSIEEALPCLHMLTELEKLTISSENEIPALPDSLGSLAKLKVLKLEGDYAESFPVFIGQLSELRSFHMSYANCDIGDIIEVLSKLPELRELHLTPYCYESWAEFDLPDSIAQLSKLEVLDMAGSVGLRVLPETIGKVTNLRELDFCNYDHQLGDEAALEALPDSLCDLIYLEKFDVFGCEKVKKLPQGFERLSALKHLDVSCTGIPEIRLSEEQISNLEYLWGQGSLPDLSRAIRLKNFAWRRIKGTDCPENGTEAHLAEILSSAPAIERLQLMDGVYEDIDFIFDMPKLKEVYLFCRVLRMPDRDELLKHGIKMNR